MLEPGCRLSACSTTVRSRGRGWCPHATEGSFAYGVASGFPSTKGITLWTRVAGLRRSAKIAYEVATDHQFKHVVASSHATAQAGRDFTVHQPVSGLKPATEYYYRFATKKADSRVGRFRTLPPADSMTPLRIGYYSCSSYEAGYYTALAGSGRGEGPRLCAVPGRLHL